MVKAYLDASVIVPILLDEAASPVVAEWMERTKARLLVSDLGAAEVSSAISIAYRTKRKTDVEAQQLVEIFDLWRFKLTTSADIESDDIRTADGFVRRFDLKLRTPDAIHAAVSQRIGATLITLDRRLLAAANALSIAAVSPVAHAMKD